MARQAKFRLGSRSLRRLEGVHPDMVKVVKRAIKISDVDFTITEGLRTLKRQKELYARGASKTLNSRHLTGHAVDLAPLINGRVSWDWPPFYEIARAMKQAAKDLDIQITWGGDWRTFKDGPHFELNRRYYKANKTYSA